MENLFQVLEKLQKILRNTLNEAKENVSKSIDNFLVDKVRQMGSMIGHYFTAFESLNVMSRKGMEEMIKQMYNYECIRDMEEELYETEEEWNLFLQEVDSKINPSSKVSKEEQVVVGSKGPCELKLIEVSTERLVHLRLINNELNNNQTSKACTATEMYPECVIASWDALVFLLDA